MLQEEETACKYSACAVHDKAHMFTVSIEKYRTIDNVKVQVVFIV